MPAQVCSGNPLGRQPHPTLMPRACTHGRTPGPGSRPRLCPRPLVKGSTVCLGFLPPPNPQDEPSTDSTIKNTILCSLVAPGDRHPDAERLLASWPDGGCCHPPTLTDHGRRGSATRPGPLSFPTHGSVRGADTVGNSYAAQRDHMPCFYCRLPCPLRVLMCCDRRHVSHTMPGQSSP